MRPYEHPYGLSARATWRAMPTLHRQAKIAVALLAAGLVGAVVLHPLLLMLAVAGALVTAYVLVAWAAVTVANTVRLTRSWRQKSELRDVLQHRPHAGETTDPDLAHDAFAVTAEDDGWLLTWRFRPLRIGASPEDHEVEVPGRPCHAASVVTEARFDAHDAARAAEQLVAAQEDAAAREAAAAAAAHGGVTDAAERAELAQEARSTAAALRRSTGQDQRR